MNMSSRCASHGWTVHFVIKSIMSAKNLAGLPDWLAKLCAVVPCKVLNVSAEDAAFTGLKEPLAASGIYTRAFGAVVADLFLSSYGGQ